jgi:HPt (histidine-containing phosphotransfer) domain-containing protein
MLFAVVEQEGDGDSVRTTAAGPIAFDEDALRHRLAGDDELMTDVITVFLDDLPARLAAIKDAVAARDADRLRLAAHMLKGAAGNLSALGLFEAANVLERIAVESHMEAADGAWRQLSVEASNVVDVLRRHSAAVTEPYPCAS